MYLKNKPYRRCWMVSHLTLVNQVKTAGETAEGDELTQSQY